jgi:4-coumarate--CoA ligase (photoactive yellow protein activation family)
VLASFELTDDLGPIVEPARRPWTSLVALGPATRTTRPGEETSRSWGDLVLSAARLRDKLASAGWRRPLLICGDRFHMAACLLACWAGDRVPVLPPGVRADLVRALIDAGAADGVVHDGGLSDATASDLDLAGLDDEESVHTGPIDLEAERRLCVGLLERRGTESLVTVYSSGSSGNPSAAHKCAAQLLGEAETLARMFGIGGAARVLSSAPAHHIYGLLFSVLVPLVGGGAFIRHTPLHAESIAALADALGANVFCSVPPHLHGLQALAHGSLAGVTRVFCSGAPLPPADAAALEQRLGLAVTEVLGSTETGGIAWRLAGGDAAWAPLPGVRVDADADGVMWLDSPFLEPGTVRPSRGADRIAMDGEGRFRHLGRVDRIVKVGGERVSLIEIEQRLLATDGVLDAAVVAIEDQGPRQRQICAAVVAPRLTAAEIRGLLRRWLDPVAIPRRIELVERLPREETGKLQLHKILTLFGAS